MARNGSGTMSIPNSFTPSTTALSSDVNENFTDVASEITNSLALDGQSVMAGQFKAANGTVSAPSVTFGSDLDSGIYRIGANNLGVAVNGAKVVDVATTGVTVTGDVNATVIKQGTYRLVPAGVTVPYAGASAPDGWLFCYGQAVSRTTYADLFTAIGTTYGAGDASTTFNLPDLRGRVVAGQDDMGGSSANRLTGLTDGVNGDTLAAAGGLESTTLTEAQLPTVTPAGSVSVSITGITLNSRGDIDSGTGGKRAAVASVDNTSTNSTIFSSGSATGSFSGTPFGSGSAHNNVQPTIILNYIIKF